MITIFEKYIKVDDRIKTGDTVVLLIASKNSIFTVGDFYKILSKDPSERSLLRYELGYLDGRSTGFWFTEDAVRKATPEEFLANKYNL
jgi:hypothetical protein